MKILKKLFPIIGLIYFGVSVFGAPRGVSYDSVTTNVNQVVHQRFHSLTNHAATASEVATYDANQKLVSSSASAMRTLLSLVPGTHVQAYDADLLALAAISGVQGDIIYHNGTSWVRLAKGTAGQVLEMNAGATAPEWDDDDTSTGGTVGTMINTSTPTQYAIPMHSDTTPTNMAPSNIVGSADGNDLTVPGTLTADVLVINPGSTDPHIWDLPYGGVFTNSGSASGLTNSMPVVFNSNAVFNAGVTVPNDSFSIAKVTGLQAGLDAKAALASPTFTGTPAAPTASAGTSTTQLATTAFVQGEVDATQTGSHASPTTTDPLAPTWGGPAHVVWYGATGEIDLPAAASYTLKVICVYNTGAFTITIDPNASEVIVREGTAQTGGVSMTLSSGAGNFVWLMSDGARWITLGKNGTLAAGS